MLDITSLLSLATINMLALISPGPDFAIIVRNSILYSRKIAFLTALGIALGNLIHVSYSVLGLGIIIQENNWILLILKYLGASYLIFIGFKNIKAKKKKDTKSYDRPNIEISSLSAIRSGLYTTILNPKCLLYFISIFSVFITPKTTTIITLLCIVIIFVEALLWFSLVAFCLSNKHAKEKFNSIGYLIDRFTGSIFIIFGLKLMLFS